MAKAKWSAAIVKAAQWLAGRPAAYEVIQRLAGRRRVASWLRSAIGTEAEGLVLDVGSAGGDHAMHYSRSAVSLDVDLAPLLAARQRRPNSLLVWGSATALPFRRRSVPLVLCIAVSHHLDDRSLELALSEMNRVATGRIVFMDAVRSESPISRLLWALDRGSNARTGEVLDGAIGSAMEVRVRDSLTVLHRYRLWIGTPRSTE